MVYYLVFIKISSQGGLNYQSVLSDIPSGVGTWMFWLKYENIPGSFLELSAIPTTVLFSFGVRILVVPYDIVKVLSVVPSPSSWPNDTTTSAPAQMFVPVLFYPYGHFSCKVLSHSYSWFPGIMTGLRSMGEQWRLSNHFESSSATRFSARRGLCFTPASLVLF